MTPPAIPSSRDVLAGRSAWGVDCADALAFLRGLPDGLAALAVFSPPYQASRTYGINHRLRGQAWVDWLRPIVVEACRVTARLVCVNVSGPVSNSRYSPAVEWLVADLTRIDGIECGPAPYAWVRPGIMGSGGPRCHRRNWEPAYAFAKRGHLPPFWSDNTAGGLPPRCPPGGGPSHRGADGVRVKFREGTKGRNRPYRAPEVANPGNVIRAGNGGGQLGHPLAHENEAPMNLEVAARLVRWYAPPGGIVLGCFAGSGTTAHAALTHGRRFVGRDIRQSQVELTARRIADVEAARGATT
jgi:hypothetical protein